MKVDSESVSLKKESDWLKTNQLDSGCLADGQMTSSKECFALEF